LFLLPKDTEMTIPLLQEFLSKHSEEVNDRYKKLKAAYESDHDILHAPAKPKYKPDNRIVVNFPKYIVDTLNGFFLGNPIKVTADDEAVSDYVEFIDQYNDQDDNNAELSKLCDIYGNGFEVYYTDEEAALCITYCSPMEAFMIYDDSIVERPMFFVRRYTDRKGNEFGEISDKFYTRKFAVTGGLRWIDADEDGNGFAHRFGDVPATEYIENAERQGAFEPVLSIVNAYNKAISEKANDVDYFADAYLKILGAKVDEAGVAFIRDNRVVNIFGEDAEKIVADFMAKPSNDVGQENLLNRLEKLAFQISMVANISDENFGQASGVALKYKLQAMLNLAKTKERKFVSGMNRRYKLLFGHPASSTKVSKDAWVQLHYQFTPNIPANLLEEAQIAAQMSGITSQETQLKVLSIVDNVQDELDKIEEENKAPERTIVDRMMFPNEQVEMEEEVIDDEQ
jgi:SPP1 family phage portal protein